MTMAAAVHKKAATLGKLAVRMTAVAGSGHPSSALSLAHIVAQLMYKQMAYDPADPWNAASDRLVLSEGHAVPIIYAAWADLGGIVGTRTDSRKLTVEDLDTLRERDSVLDGHPNPGEGFPFFDAATGSLGQGLSVAAGLALAAKLDGSPRRVYCIIGDGESREGQIWEAADFIADKQLANVCAFFNCNKHGQAAPVSNQQSAAKLAAKLEAFGWNVAQINGHDPREIGRALAEFDESQKRPMAIVAETLKGWGVDALLDGNWHGKPLKVEQLDDANASLDRWCAEASKSLPAGEELPGPQTPAAFDLPAAAKTAAWPSFEEALRGAGLADALEKGKLATRRAYGAGLKTAGDVMPRVVALDADVSNSTFSAMFAKEHESRFVECKIAEQNMVSVGAGMSAGGYIPFANSFAKFLSRALDQIELANISRANLKLVGSHAGISLAADGPSQMSLPDIAFFCSFAGVSEDGQPLAWLFQPADAVAAYHCTRLMTELDGMCYMRTHRPDVPFLYNDDTPFELGGLQVLGDGTDLAIVTSGYMVHEALKAVESLAQKGIHASVVDVYVMPVKPALLIDAVRNAGKKALVVEDNYPGLGPAIAAITGETGDIRVATLACQRRPRSTRTTDEILDYCGVAAPQIVERAAALCQ